jgi:hypothetical protein
MGTHDKAGGTGPDWSVSKNPIADKLSQNRVNFCKLEIFSVREIRLIVIIPPGT